MREVFLNDVKRTVFSDGNALEFYRVVDHGVESWVVLSGPESMFNAALAGVSVEDIAKSHDVKIVDEGLRASIVAEKQSAAFELAFAANI